MTTLKVTKIIDEMVDLETGQQFSHGIVVSNGRREEFIPLSKESLRPLILLYAETLEEPVDHVPDQTERAIAYSQRREAQERVERIRDHLSGSSDSDRLRETARPKPQLIDPTNQVEFTPASPPEEDEEVQPGEEYEDELTGVASF